MGATDHRKQAETKGQIALAVVTVSDTRTPETDVSGQLIRELAEAAGHRVLLLEHRDLRELGSGNAGATNVLRVAGRGPAALTLILAGSLSLAFMGFAGLLSTQ